MTVQPTQRGYEAVIFDLDRTLVEHDQDSSNLFRAACSATGTEQFCDPETLERAADVVRYESEELDAKEYERRVFETAAAANGADIPAEELVQAYNCSLDNDEVSLRPGAEAALAAAEDLSSAIVTNGPSDTHTMKIEAVGLADRVDTVIYGDDVSRVKPATDPFELALDRLRTDPDDVLKVGDSLYKDVRGANKLGIDTVWIPFGEPNRSANDPEPTFTTESLSDIPEFLSA